MAKRRVGGLRVDPEVERWQRTAATNVAALTAKQKKDRKRVRVKYDMELDLKQRIERAAEAEGTSASQLAAFLLGWVMDHWESENSPTGHVLRGLVEGAKVPSRSLRFEWNLSDGESD